jgi:hypothetical protein
MLLEVRKQDEACQLGLFTRLTSYKINSMALTSVPSVLACQHATTRLAPGHAEPVKVYERACCLTNVHGWGPRFATICQPSDLEPLLVDGCLKLRLTILEIL